LLNHEVFFGEREIHCRRKLKGDKKRS